MKKKKFIHKWRYESDYDSLMLRDLKEVAEVKKRCGKSEIIEEPYNDPLKEVKEAYVNGEPIQFFHTRTGKWESVAPFWIKGVAYRIKPKDPIQ